MGMSEIGDHFNYSLKTRIEKFRLRQKELFNLYGKNVTPLSDADAELMLEIINLLEEEVNNMAAFINR